MVTCCQGGPGRKKRKACRPPFALRSVTYPLVATETLHKPLDAPLLFFPRLPFPVVLVPVWLPLPLSGQAPLRATAGDPRRPVTFFMLSLEDEITSDASICECKAQDERSQEGRSPGSRWLRHRALDACMARVWLSWRNLEESFVMQVELWEHKTACETYAVKCRRLVKNLLWAVKVVRLDKISKCQASAKGS